MRTLRDARFGAVPLITVSMLMLAVPARASANPAEMRPTVEACQPRVVDGVLPSWARAGFSASRPRMPYELGEQGRIAAILWADPLEFPPPRTHNNKILWVSRVSSNGSPLVIDAQRMEGTKRVGTDVRRTVLGGPGPSIINLPAAGCWRLTLTWSGHSDAMDVRYVATPAS